MATVWKKTKNLNLNYADLATQGEELFDVKALITENFQAIDTLDPDTKLEEIENKVTALNTAIKNLNTAIKKVNSTSTAANTATTSAATQNSTNDDILTNTKKAINVWLDMQNGVYVALETSVPRGYQTYLIHDLSPKNKDPMQVNFNPFAVIIFADGLKPFTIIRNGKNSERTTVEVQDPYGNTVWADWSYGYITIRNASTKESEFFRTDTTYYCITLNAMEFYPAITRYLKSTIPLT